MKLYKRLISKEERYKESSRAKLRLAVRRPRKQGKGMNTSPMTDPITRTEEQLSMSNLIDLKQIDPLLELIDDPVAFIRSKYYATENERVLAARKQAYSQGFETAIKTNRNLIYRRGYIAGAVAAGIKA